jgi:acyl transferase domain-containing protein
MPACETDPVRPKLVQLFPGQGSQWPGMGRDLLDASPAFRSTIAGCDQRLRPRLGWSVHDALAESDAERLQGILGLQVMLFSVEIALGALWRERGVPCDGVAGTSLGEIAAAYVCAALSLDDALDIVVARSELLEAHRPEGGTVVLNVDGEQVAQVLAGLEDQAWVAGFNGPGTTTFSGREQAIVELLHRGEALGVFAARVRVEYPAHSPLLLPLADALRDSLRNIRPRDGEVAFYSAVTGGEVRGRDLDADYWVQNLVAPVRGRQLLDCILSNGVKVILEVTPHPIFAKPTEDAIAARVADACHCPTLRRNTDAAPCLAAANARLLEAGIIPSSP